MVKTGNREQLQEIKIQKIISKEERKDDFKVQIKQSTLKDNPGNKITKPLF